MTTTIYILKLNNNKYYVGKTNRLINERYEEHLEGIGSLWTKKYKPQSIIKQIENSSPFDEDRYVNTIKFLKNEFKTSNNECYKCGSTSHFASECEYISIDDYIQFFITNLNSINCLDEEIRYLKDKYKNIKAIYDLYETRSKLLCNVLKCDYCDIDAYSNQIKTYYDKFCNNDTYIDVLIIQYYECIFEYKEFYKRCNHSSFSFLRRYLPKELNDNLNNMECEKFNKYLDNINLDIIIRQMGAIMKLKLDLI